jgi:hypothetical protein
VKAEDVLELYASLLEHGVQIWLDGGWGVDALLERQTRPHKDLDAIVALDDLPSLTATLSQRGFVLKEIWAENQTEDTSYFASARLFTPTSTSSSIIFRTWSGSSNIGLCADCSNV